MNQTETMSIWVSGVPVAQGSMTGFAIKSKKTGKTHVAMTHASEKLPEWRNAIVDELDAFILRSIERGRPWVVERRPYSLDVDFYLPRPKSHSKVERLCRWRYQTPDLDKLVRAVMDALEVSGVLKDDARVASLKATKTYSIEGEGAYQPGAAIALTPCLVPNEWVMKEEK